MNILVALDRPPYSDAVIDAVIAEMRPADSEIRLIHVDDPFPRELAEDKGSAEYPDYEAARREQTSQAEHLLQAAAERLQAAGFTTSGAVREGNAEESILAEAEAWNADLIILGYHERSALKRLLSKDFSATVIREAPCSVQIVKIQPPGTFGKPSP